MIQLIKEELAFSTAIMRTLNMHGFHVKSKSEALECINYLIATTNFFESQEAMEEAECQNYGNSSGLKNTGLHS
jgi:hypothetical protein